MNSPAMLLFLIPVVFGAGALILGLALAAAATGVSESFEERWEPSPPAGLPSIPMTAQPEASRTRAA